MQLSTRISYRKKIEKDAKLSLDMTTDQTIQENPRMII
jgi:hypothetical protein